MADNIAFRPPPEPAHVSIIRHYEDLVAILKLIREKAQPVIDQGFDRVSSQIGFVVATTVPVTAEVAEGGKIKGMVLRGAHLQGTLFEKELLQAMKEVTATKVAAHQGKYDLYLIWFDALKLKLSSGAFRPPPEPAHFRLAAELARFRPPPEPAHYHAHSAELVRTELARLLAGFRPPPEPAHFRFPEGLSQFGQEAATSFLGRFRPPPEPAHWFDPGVLINEAEQVMIVALDEVYPELRLVERISASRLEQVALNPQPLPPKALERLVSIFGPSPDPWTELKDALSKLVEAEGPRPEPWKERMLAEIAEVIRKYRGH
jgi:hypothetical protein